MSVLHPVGVLLINLDTRGDRLSAMTRMLDAMGIACHRISAVDGRSVPQADLACSRKTGPIGAMPDTTRACTASHVKAWQHIVDTGLRHALILEDDAVLHPDVTALIADDGWIPAGVDLVKVEKFAPKRASKILAGKVLARTPAGQREVRRMYSRHTGSAGYIISRKGAEIALSLSGSYDVPVDHLLFNETVSRLCGLLRPAIVVPPLVWQDNSVGLGSDIKAPRLAENNAVRRKPFARLALSLRRAANEVSLLHIQLFLLATGRAQVVTLTTPQSRGRALPGLWRKIWASDSA
ncbi:hypothetical protein HYN69_10820 [Gemmobacter aquarius]|uniref:Glycosyl transferase family 25 domain-containing protein n=1 Tax=Paragemmobacter aquarius TaxID=2169400 RepID=A0A2S0UM68_9RHOB|nr:hypothetical protein HYN69_10820 [Gemmobacter aquarius]